MKAIEIARFSFVLAVFSLILAAPSIFAGTYYISPTGDDSGGNGTSGNPWQSIIHATGAIPDNGSTIIMEDGTYTTQSLSRSFTNPVTVIAQDPYKVIVNSRSNNSRAFDIESGSNVTFSGMNIFGTGNTTPEYLVYISGPANNITFTNDIIHDNYENDLVKINNAAYNITFKGNVLYNQNQSTSEGNELFDINTVQNVNIEANIMLDDYARSGQTNTNQTQSFIVIKNSGDSLPNYTQNITVKRNVFMNWAGRDDESFVLFGEDAKPFWEAQNCVVENNLFLMNNNTNPTPGAIMLKGGIKGITIRANTISGNPLGGGGYGATIQQLAPNAQMQSITFANNIWTDQAGGMVNFSSTTSSPIAPGNLTMDSNIYWNGGKSIPNTGVMSPNLDPKKILTNPGLPDPAGLVDSWWNPTTLQFVSGTTSIAAEFVRVVDLYGALPGGSPAIDAADPSNMPTVDILGNPRDSRPDIGCFEYIATPGDADKDGKIGPADLAIVALNWDPSGKTETWWTGDFDGDGAVGPSDLALIGLNWNPSGTTGQVSPMDSVPEPATLAMLALTALASLFRRKPPGRQP